MQYKLPVTADFFSVRHGGRFLRWLALILIAHCLLLAGKSHAGHVEIRDGHEIVHLRVFDYPDTNDPNPFVRAEVAVLRHFQSVNPNIVLERGAGLTVKGMELDAAPLMAIAGGVAPDIILVNFRQSDSYVQQGFLTPLDEYIEELQKEAPGELEEMIPAPVMPVARREGPDGKTHYWMVPTEFCVTALFYRKDMFVQAGLDPEKPPQTWDELMYCARKLTNPQKNVHGLVLMGGLDMSYHYMNFLWSAGGECLERDAAGQWRAVFNSDAAAEAAWFYKEIMTTKWRDSEGQLREGFATTNWDDWATGKAAMAFTYLDSTTIIRGASPEQTGIAPVPRGPRGDRGSEINCRMNGIFSGVKDKRVRDAAWKYLRFLGGTEAQRVRVQSLIDSGMGRLVNPILLKKFGYPDYLKRVPPGLLEVFEEAVRTGRPEPYGRNCQYVYRYLSRPLQEVVELASRGRLPETKENQIKFIRGRMDHWAAVCNEEMIGIIPPEKQRMRSIVASVIVALIAAGFLFLFRYVWRAFTPEHATGGGWHFRRYATAYLLLAPALAAILFWQYLPLLRGTVISFQNYSIIGKSTFAGLGNYAAVLFDAEWWHSVFITAKYMLLMLALGFLPPVILAILLQEVSQGKTIYRIIFYLPAVLAGPVVIFLWKLFYEPTPEGMLNQVIKWVGIEPQRWLQDTRLALLCCVIPTVWAGFGPGSILYLAALKGVPNELYEAADLDGAGFLSKVRHVVFPSLKGILIIQFIGFFIMAAQTADFIFIMTFGGPNHATYVSGLAIFEKSYMYLKFGPATAMAWILATMLIGFTMLQMKRLSRMQFRTTPED